MGATREYVEESAHTIHLTYQERSTKSLCPKKKIKRGGLNRYFRGFTGQAKLYYINVFSSSSTLAERSNFIISNCAISLIASKMFKTMKECTSPRFYYMKNKWSDPADRLDQKTEQLQVYHYVYKKQLACWIQKRFYGIWTLRRIFSSSKVHTKWLLFHTGFCKGHNREWVIKCRQYKFYVHNWLKSAEN